MSAAIFLKRGGQVLALWVVVGWAFISCAEEPDYITGTSLENQNTRFEFESYDVDRLSAFLQSEGAIQNGSHNYRALGHWSAEKMWALTQKGALYRQKGIYYLGLASGALIVDEKERNAFIYRALTEKLSWSVTGESARQALADLMLMTDFIKANPHREEIVELMVNIFQTFEASQAVEYLDELGFFYRTGSTSTLQVDKIEFLPVPLLRQIVQCGKKNLFYYISSVRTVRTLENLIEKKEQESRVHKK